jgi:hypothetical protein
MFGLKKKDGKIDLFLTSPDMGNLDGKTLEGRVRNEIDRKFIPVNLTTVEGQVSDGCSVKYEKEKYDIQITKQTYYMLIGSHYIQTKNVDIGYMESVESKAPHMKLSLDILKQISK